RESNGEMLSQCALSKGAGQNRDKRDRDLRRGKKPIGLSCKIDSYSGSATSLVRELLQARFTGRNDGHFSHYKDAGDDAQQHDDEDRPDVNKNQSRLKWGRN